MTHVLDSRWGHQGHAPGPELPQEGPSIPRDQAGAETSLKQLPADAFYVCFPSLTRAEEPGSSSPWTHRFLR